MTDRILHSEMMKKFFGTNIFDEFDEGAISLDLQGWGGHQLLHKIIEETDLKTIIEVGAWKGRSAVSMAQKCKELNRDAVVICCDTWLGSPEHFRETFSEDLNRLAGYPRLYYQFLANVKRSDVHDIIVPLPLSSVAGARVLKRHGVKADLIHVDGDHSYTGAYADICAYWPLLKDDGVMICDDYAGWQGVTRAVNEFAAKHAISVMGTHGKALLSLSKTMKFRAVLRTIDQGAWKPKAE